MSIQLNIFLIIFGGIQGLLFFLFLLRKKLYRSGYIFLQFYFAIMLLQLTLKVMDKLWLMDNWPFLYALSHYLPLLYGPLVYLLIKGFVERRHFNLKAILHFLPFIFVTLFIALAQFQILPFAIDNILYNPHVRLFFLSLSLTLYHFIAWRGWQKLRLSLQHYLSDSRLIQMSWLRSFVLLSFIVCSVVVLAIYLLYLNYPFGHEYRYGFAGLTLFIYWISYSALKQPVIFSVIKGQAETDDNHFPKLVAHKPKKKYARSTLNNNEKDRICETLHSLVKNDKIYLDTELTIDRLAEKVKCSRHSLSQVLNECMQQSFYEYINQYRVEEAKMLLTDESGKENKIASIGYDAGFNSLSTFNEVFKKLSGYTPSQYRRYPDGYSTRQRV